MTRFARHLMFWSPLFIGLGLLFLDPAMLRQLFGVGLVLYGLLLVLMYVSPNDMYGRKLSSYGSMAGFLHDLIPPGAYLRTLAAALAYIVLYGAVRIGLVRLMEGPLVEPGATLAPVVAFILAMGALYTWAYLRQEAGPAGMEKQSSD